MRVGLGYDVHKLVEDRKLIIGGVEIPYEKGLLGHSECRCIITRNYGCTFRCRGTWRYRKAFSRYRMLLTRAYQALSF